MDHDTLLVGLARECGAHGPRELGKNCYLEGMSITSDSLVDGPGWRLDDVRCSAGPGDRPFEERHDAACIALVRSGSFTYRNGHGRALLAPGACLLGEAGQDFECSHEHHAGDHCLSFHYTPEFLESVLGGVRGARRMAFGAARLAPTHLTLRQFAAVEAAHAVGDRATLTECALELAGTVYDVLINQHDDALPPSARDLRRVSAALRRMESSGEADTGLDTLAAEAAMSPYHFLRVFRRVVGMSPRQYQLRQRLSRAAVALRAGDMPVVQVALAAGFGDLSSFDRMFKREFGRTPRAWRRAVRA